MPSSAAHPRLDRSAGPVRRHHGTLLAVFVLASLSKLASLTLDQQLRGCDGPMTVAPRINEAAAGTDHQPHGLRGGNATNATTKWTPHDPHSIGLPRTKYEILTLKWSLEAHPLRKKNVERMQKHFDGLFHVDYAVDVAEDYETVNEIFDRNNITCEGMGTGLTLGAIGLWASTIRSWERVLTQGDEYDYLVIVQDDVDYGEDARGTVPSLRLVLTIISLLPIDHLFYDAQNASKNIRYEPPWQNLEYPRKPLAVLRRAQPADVLDGEGGHGKLLLGQVHTRPHEGDEGGVRAGEEEEAARHVLRRAGDRRREYELRLGEARGGRAEGFVHKGHREKVRLRCEVHRQEVAKG